MDNESMESLNGEESNKDKNSDLVKLKNLKNLDTLYKTLINEFLKYNPSTDVAILEKAYNVANKAHNKQIRKSGEPFIIHPLSVGIILAELRLDKETIVAGLLHDTVEDTFMTKKEVAELFGGKVAFLVDGVTKLTQFSDSIDKIEMQAENFRKMLIAMTQDIRVILIKLADRLHNIRTLSYQSPKKQKEIAKETMDIYAPIAQRLGIFKIKVELEDLSFQYLYSDVYSDLVEKINLLRENKKKLISKVLLNIESNILKTGISANVNNYEKNIFSIYRKMVNQNKTLEQIYDLFSIEIIVDTVRECYLALGIIHKLYTPILGRFKDYIAMPKENMYQSLHTTVVAGSGEFFKIQIRTTKMNFIAEYGIVAYLRNKHSFDNKVGKKNEEYRLKWLNQILEWHKDMSDNKEFMNLLKNDLDLFSENVYCFTPSGNIKCLPMGSNVIDFAYNIHSDIGNNMVGAKVNGKVVQFSYIIQNNDRIEVITSQNSHGPYCEWLNLVRSTQAKNKLNKWLKKEFKNGNIKKGTDFFDEYCERKEIVKSDILKLSYIESVLKKYKYKCWNDILLDLGLRILKEDQIINELLKEKNKESASENFIESESDNEYNGEFNDLEFQKSLENHDLKTYFVKINIYANNKIGILSSISNKFIKFQIDITSIDCRIDKQGVAIINMSFTIKDKKILNDLMNEIRNIENIINCNIAD